MTRRILTILTLLLLSGCGTEQVQIDRDAGDELSDQSGTLDGDLESELDAADLPSDSRDVISDMSDGQEMVDTNDDVDMTDTVDPPQDISPCAAGGPSSCWDTSLNVFRCGSDAINENYSTGNYNVHHYVSQVFGGTETDIALERTEGSWQPALVVRSGSETLFDGEIGLQSAGVSVNVVSTGRTGATVSVVIASSTDRPLDVYVTGWSVVDGGFADYLPMDSTYTLTGTSVCDGENVACQVNGHMVAEPACGWLNYIGRNVVQHMPGSRDEQLTDAARVAWWSLKEGVLFLDNPIVYSNCNFPEGDMHIGPLDTCVSGRAWQVGMSGVQVPTFTLLEIEDTARSLYPGQSVSDILEQAATDALLPPQEVAAVVSSTGDLRKSWLLRESAIGFTVQEPIVTRECIDDTRSWCFGTGWNSTALYAPDRAGAMQSIADIRAMFDQLAP